MALSKASLGLAPVRVRLRISSKRSPSWIKARQGSNSSGHTPSPVNPPVQGCEPPPPEEMAADEGIGGDEHDPATVLDSALCDPPTVPNGAPGVAAMPKQTQCVDLVSEDESEAPAQPIQCMGAQALQPACSTVPPACPEPAHTSLQACKPPQAVPGTGEVQHCPCEPPQPPCATVQISEPCPKPVQTNTNVQTCEPCPQLAQPNAHTCEPVCSLSKDIGGFMEEYEQEACKVEAPVKDPTPKMVISIDDDEDVAPGRSPNAQHFC